MKGWLQEAPAGALEAEGPAKVAKDLKAANDSSHKDFFLPKRLGEKLEL